MPKNKDPRPSSTIKIIFVYPLLFDCSFRGVQKTGPWASDGRTATSLHTNAVFFAKISNGIRKIPHFYSCSNVSVYYLNCQHKINSSFSRNHSLTVISRSLALIKCTTLCLPLLRFITSMDGWLNITKICISCIPSPEPDENRWNFWCDKVHLYVHKNNVSIIEIR